MDAKPELIVDFCCRGKKCPQIFRRPDGSVIIRGYKVDIATEQYVNAGDHEGVVEVPAAVIDVLIKVLGR